MNIALVTCVTKPEIDPDEPFLLEALRARGVTPALLAWDDPAADVRAHDLLVLRSTWNYHRDLDAFLAWTRHAGAAGRLVNPPHVVAANAQKSYLVELEARGVGIVPTAIVRRGERPSLAAIAGARGWQTVVVKPLVSAGSFRTERFAEGELAEGDRFLHDLSADRDVLVQRWMPAVETSGERSLVWIDGELSHAVRKAPRFSGGHEAVSQGAVPIGDDERAFA